jgi:hypothetical protein
VKEVLPHVSLRRICSRLAVSRSTVSVPDRIRREPVVDELLAARVHRLMLAHPTFGYRRIW